MTTHLGVKPDREELIEMVERAAKVASLLRGLKKIVYPITSSAAGEECGMSVARAPHRLREDISKDQHGNTLIPPVSLLSVQIWTIRP